MRCVWRVAIVAGILGGGITLALAVIPALSPWSGGVLTLAMIGVALALCGRLPGQSFFKDSSPMRAYDSLQYP